MLVTNTPYDDTGHEEAAHPERPDRLRAARQAVERLHLGDDLVVAPQYRATRADLARVHSPLYLDHLGAFCYEGGGDLDPDTYATYDSWSIATLAAGSGLAVTRVLKEHDAGVGFVATRPPGHHALSDRAMGFCLLNNVAVTASALADAGERVLIVDWDVHHGNGTQQIFWNDPRVLYVSTHQWPLYPGSGVASEVGGWRALNTTVNVPVPPGATGDVLERALDEVAAPLIDAFAPTWVLVSAGFDAHRDDPLASLELTSGDFSRLATTVRGFAPRDGRLVFFLEGGYDLRALAHSVHATLAAVLDARDVTEPPSRGGPGHEMVKDVVAQRALALELQYQTALADAEIAHPMDAPRGEG